MIFAPTDVFVFSWPGSPITDPPPPSDRLIRPIEQNIFPVDLSIGIGYDGITIEKEVTIRSDGSKIIVDLSDRIGYDGRVVGYLTTERTHRHLVKE